MQGTGPGQGQGRGRVGVARVEVSRGECECVCDRLVWCAFATEWECGVVCGVVYRVECCVG